MIESVCNFRWWGGEVGVNGKGSGNDIFSLFYLCFLYLSLGCGHAGAPAGQMFCGMNQT